MAGLVKVFTDGSSSKNGKKNCKSGCGVYFESEIAISMSSEEASEFCKVPFSQNSNNVGELLGILVALVHQSDKEVDMLIHTDSMYCLNSITVWSPRWSKNNWVTSCGVPVKNKELIERILEEKKKFKNVYFKHVKAHTREPIDNMSQEWQLWFGNYQADKLATNAVHI